MPKMVFLADIHGPMTAEQEQMYEDSLKHDVIMLEGDVFDSRSQINYDTLKDIIKVIPSLSLQEMMYQLTPKHEYSKK